MFGAFFKIMMAEFIAEMGDKTQLMLVALTSKFKLRDIILGTAAAILILNGLAVLLGGFISSLVPQWIIKFIAAAAFLYFAITSLAPEDSKPEHIKYKKRRLFAPLAVFITFFIAELGDKTQLTAITFGANEGLNKAILVWLACSVGLFAADIIGMLIGYLLKNKFTDQILKMLSFIIFSIFGVITFHTALILLLNRESQFAFSVTILGIIAYMVVCVFYYLKTHHKQLQIHLDD